MKKIWSIIPSALLPLLCENFGTILLVLVDLTAYSLAGWQSDEILGDLNFLISHMPGL